METFLGSSVMQTKDIEEMISSSESNVGNSELVSEDDIVGSVTSVSQAESQSEKASEKNLPCAHHKIAAGRDNPPIHWENVVLVANN